MANSKRKSFWEQVAKTNDARSCWLWQGALNPGGYGRWGQELAHRASYRLTRGMVPHGKMVCHTCDNPQCVRPNHLFAGTAFDNAMDAKRKRLWAKPPSNDVM